MSENKNVQDIISKVETLTVLELAELVSALEEKFGVVAAAPVAAAPAAQASASEGAAGEEKTDFTVVITAAGEQKINVIKAVREINPDLGLKDAKDLVDSPPSNILENVDKEKADAAKAKLEEAGATIELQ